MTEIASLYGIYPGDRVLCLRTGTQDREGYPSDIPVVGRQYTIIGFYRKKYGWGCQLEDLNPEPYEGYVFQVKGRPPFFSKIPSE